MSKSNRQKVQKYNSVLIFYFQYDTDFRNVNRKMSNSSQKEFCVYKRIFDITSYFQLY